MIPLEQGLYKKLLLWQMMNPKKRFMFDTGNDKPDTHFLETCKVIAKRAGMDRTKFKVHRFRDTFATWALRRCVDLRTVSDWLGHANIELTQKYLAPMQGKQAQGQINKAFSTTLAVSATA